LGDPYHCECLKTGRLLAEALGLAKDQYRITFQSRFGRARWLEPYTEPTLKQMAAEGQKRVDVVCPGFAVDCLETLEEIAQEARDAFLASGGEVFHYIPCLNDGTEHVRVIRDIASHHLQGWPIPGPQAGPEQARSRERALASGASD
jgi:ferrochelatase